MAGAARKPARVKTTHTKQSGKCITVADGWQVEHAIRLPTRTLGGSASRLSLVTAPTESPSHVPSRSSSAALARTQVGSFG